MHSDNFMKSLKKWMCCIVMWIYIGGLKTSTSPKIDSTDSTWKKVLFEYLRSGWILWSCGVLGLGLKWNKNGKPH